MSFMCYDIRSNIESPQEISDDDNLEIEKFVVTTYSQTCNTFRVNETRQMLFTRSNRSIENLPPTSAALKQHVKRSTLQAMKWRASLNKCAEAKDPQEWGWKLKAGGTGFVPHWSDLPEVSKACGELLKCGCKINCSSGRCKCVKAELSCTTLCGCNADCEN